MILKIINNKFKDVTKSVLRGDQEVLTEDKEKGFTFVELIASLLILVILSVIIVPNVINIIDKNKISLYESKSLLVEETAEIYYARDGKIPTSGEAVISREVEDQMKQVLSEIGVRYVNKAFNEIIDNNLIKFVDKNMLYTNPYQALDRQSTIEEDWVVIDHIKTAGEENFKYYRNELFGKVMNEEAVKIGKDKYIGTLGKYKQEWPSFIIEEKTDESITVSNMDIGNTLKLYKDDVLLGILHGNGTLSFDSENYIQTYKLELEDSDGKVIFERDLKGIPDYTNLRISSVDVKEDSLNGDIIIDFNGSLCLDEGDVCVSSDEVTINLSNIQRILVNGVPHGFNFPVVLDKDSVTSDIDISVVINGKKTKPLKIYMNR